MVLKTGFTVQVTCSLDTNCGVSSTLLNWSNLELLFGVSILHYTFSMLKDSVIKLSVNLYCSVIKVDNVIYTELHFHVTLELSMNHWHQGAMHLNSHRNIMWYVSNIPLQIWCWDAWWKLGMTSLSPPPRNSEYNMLQHNSAVFRTWLCPTLYPYARRRKIAILEIYLTLLNTVTIMIFFSPAYIQIFKKRALGTIIVMWW